MNPDQRDHLRADEPGRINLDGSNLKLGDLMRVAKDPRVTVQCDPQAMARVEHGWRQIERVVAAYRKAYKRWQEDENAPPPVFDYGVTTGFGEFKNIPIHPDELEQLQRNILLSHSVGVGINSNPDDPANYFPPEVVRAALLIRLNAFLRGHSGIRRQMVECVLAMLNRGIIPLIPLRGSVGSSGDLCPLAHLFVTLLGEGRYYRVKEAADLLQQPRNFKAATELEGDLGLPPVSPSFKEGLSLTNGATFSAAMLGLAVVDAEATANSADVAAALSLEAVCGCVRALDPKIHAARGQIGQEKSAQNLRRLLRGSRLIESGGAVQDVYSLRCAPQVHGASRDAISYARMVAEREINAATDNPLFFPGNDEELHITEPFDFEFRENWPEGYRGDQRVSYSAGNFHGQPLALAADFLAIGLAELANISERRTQMLLDSHHSRGLPGNLVPKRGVNSGYMIIQYCAASMVSENKVLTHPASVDSIPTSANSEDHVAMATHGARKLLTVLGNVQAVLAIELLVATQAVEWRVVMSIDPRPGSQTGDQSSAKALENAEDESESFKRGTTTDKRSQIATRLGRGTAAAYLAVRDATPPMLEDRPLDEDIRSVRRDLEHQAQGVRLLEAVGQALGEPLAPIKGFCLTS